MMYFSESVCSALRAIDSKIKSYELCIMYFKATYRYNKTTGDLEDYYRLVESYRNALGEPRQRTILTLGILEEKGMPMDAVAERVNQLVEGKFSLFLPEAKVEQFARQLYQRLISEKKIVSRAVYPASELKTADFIRENSSICELTGYPIEKISKDKLYKLSKKLYLEKDGLERHLSRKTRELFDLEDKIILVFLARIFDNREIFLREKFTHIHIHHHGYHQGNGENHRYVKQIDDDAQRIGILFLKKLP